MADITEKTGNGELVTNRDQLVGVDNIEPLIKIIRGQQVMLDRDLATLYGVETKRLNEQVKRNIKRFPEDFMFQLTKDECLRSQIATLNEGSNKRIEDMHRLMLKHSVCHMTASFAQTMMCITQVHPLRTQAKSGLVSQRWRYLHQMNWQKGSIESNQYAIFQEYNY